MLSINFAAIAKVDDLRQALSDAGYRYQTAVPMGDGTLEEVWLHPVEGGYFFRHRFGAENVVVIACEAY